jgi:hypothetical protein
MPRVDVPRVLAHLALAAVTLAAVLCALLARDIEQRADLALARADLAHYRAALALCGDEVESGMELASWTPESFSVNRTEE